MSMQPPAAYRTAYPPPSHQQQQQQQQQPSTYNESTAYEDVQRYNAHFSSLRQPPSAAPFPSSLSHSRSTPAALSQHFTGSSTGGSDSSSSSAQQAANMSSLPPLPPLPEFNPLLQQVFDIGGYRSSYQPRAASFSSLGSQQSAPAATNFDPYGPSSSYRPLPPADPSRPLQHQPPLMSTQSQPPSNMAHRRRTAPADGYGAAGGNGAYSSHTSRLTSHPYHRVASSAAVSQRPVAAAYPPQQPHSSQQSRALSQPAVSNGGYSMPPLTYSPPLMPEWDREEGRLSGAVNRIKIDGSEYIGRDTVASREQQHQPYTAHHQQHQKQQQQQQQQQQQRQRQHNIDLTHSPPLNPLPAPASSRTHQHTQHYKSSPPNHPAAPPPPPAQSNPPPPPPPPPSTNPPSPRSSISAHELGDRYTLLDYLGSGSYGHVHLAQHRQGQYTVAIKKIIHIFDNLTNAKRLLREIKILRMLKFENVIHFYHLLPPANINDFNDLSIVFEFVDTDLQKLIHSNQHFTNLHIQYCAIITHPHTQWHTTGAVVYHC